MSSNDTHICTDCGRTYTEETCFGCHNCSALICPHCGGEIMEIEEYDDAVRINMQEMEH